VGDAFSNRNVSGFFTVPSQLTLHKFRNSFWDYIFSLALYALMGIRDSDVVSSAVKFS
jgi:hypothetical protein